MQLHTQNGCTLGTLPLFSAMPFLVHGFSTRCGGVSTGIYTSLNLGLKTGDDVGKVRENMRIFAEALGANTQNLVLSDQTHTDHIRVITKGDAGKGYRLPPDYTEIDGLITAEKNLPLLIFHADCVPILFVDRKQRIIGAAHAGWRGTRLQIAVKMVETFRQVFQSDPQDIYAAVGPCIGLCCYEVDEAVHREFVPLLGLAHDKPFFVAQAGGKYRLDLAAVNKAVLQAAGVPEGQIVLSDLCTCCHKDLFFSHRGHQGKRGLCASLIQLK